jgi:hypothetical protein
MKATSIFVFVISASILVGCARAPRGSDEPIFGIDHPLQIGEAQITVLDARIRNSMQTHYMMSYPKPGHSFYTVTLSMDGINNDPDATLEWGVANLRLTRQNENLSPVEAQRTIADEYVEYKADEQVSFINIYYFEVPQDLDYSSYYLSLPNDQTIPLASIIQVPIPAGFSSLEIDLNNVVSGGSDNLAEAFHATISGGQMNVASASHTTVGGGRENSAHYFYATIGGGYANTATGRDTVVGGGSRNIASDARATVGGGIQNNASAPDTTIAGGAYNIASDDFAAVGGGTRNSAEGFSSTIAGGVGNTTSGDQATISGGLGNQASGSYATVSGGHGNIASGGYSAIPGGMLNFAGGDYSVVTGYRAQVGIDHPGAFLFADSRDFDFPSESANEFAVRATGGVRFVTQIDEDGEPIVGVSLPPGSGAWSTLSDREVKENITQVDPQEILLSVAGLPISTWNYTGSDSSTLHIGPMAQDFSATFGFGEDDRHISTVDADGVSLAAIQGLYKIVQEQESKINTLETNYRLTQITLVVSICLCLKLFWFRRSPQNQS